jgi:hypothetical protein
MKEGKDQGDAGRFDTKATWIQQSTRPFPAMLWDPLFSNLAARSVVC